MATQEVINEMVNRGNEAMGRGNQADEIARLREIIMDAQPYVERAHAMTPGGPKRSNILGLLNRMRAAIPITPTSQKRVP